MATEGNKKVNVVSSGNIYLEFKWAVVETHKDKNFAQNTTLIFGSENSGITPELLEKSDDVRFIESFGSTRSVNVGAAAAIAMYEWTRQNLWR